MISKEASETPLRFGFLLVDKDSMIAVSSAIETLRMANRLTGKILYEWPVLTLDGNPIAASNGLMITANFSINSSPKLDMLFVCAGMDVSGVYSKKATGCTVQI